MPLWLLALWVLGPLPGGTEPSRDLLRLPYPQGAPGYRPACLIEQEGGFVLGGEVQSPESGWDLSLLRLNSSFDPGEHRVLSGDRSDSLN